MTTRKRAAPSRLPGIRPQPWSRAKWAAVIALSLLGLCAGGIYLLLRQTPAFYQRELDRPAAERQAASDLCLAKASATVSQAQHPGAWRAEFTADDLNGWLAYDLPTNHPEILGDDIHAPRIALEEHRGQLAFEYRGIVNTVVTLEFDLEARDPHTLAVRLISLRAGAVSLPLGLLIDEVTRAAESLDHRLTWEEENGQPIALLRLTDLEHDERELSIVDLRVEPERVILLGETRAQPQP